jgi:hypothetical protein
MKYLQQFISRHHLLHSGLPDFSSPGTANNKCGNCAIQDAGHRHGFLLSWRMGTISQATSSPEKSLS